MSISIDCQLCYNWDCINKKCLNPLKCIWLWRYKITCYT